MSAREQVISQALKLTEAERLEIAELLYQSVAGPPDPEAAQKWSDEIASRLDQAEAGRAKLIPWTEARRRIAGDDADERAAS